MARRLPDDLQQKIRRELGVTSLKMHSVGGGCISGSVIVTTDRGSYFVKWDDIKRHGIVAAEAEGLERLRAVGAVRVPEVYMWGRVNKKYVYMLTEAFANTVQRGDFDEMLGRRLAGLHRSSAFQFGLGHNNMIGTLVQENTWEEDWPTFFIEYRLKPQMRRAREAGFLTQEDITRFERLFGRLDGFFPDEEPALLHGDLWAGNVISDENGEPVLIDPAVYYGHREIELAFTKLFGGFSDRFYAAYHAESPIAEGFEERVPVYNLYPLLVHLNIFGRMYYSPLKDTLERYA